MRRTLRAQRPRRLRVFAFDPATANQHANRDIRTLTITLPSSLDHKDRDMPFLGPRGEYLEVVDYDPASGCFYPPIDLNDREIDSLDGLAPSEDNPQFHQQMVYAVAMQTISIFESVLGRVALWSPRIFRDENGKVDRAEFVRRLRIYPHALREPNAYYDPKTKALLFGYFTTGPEADGLVPNQTIFTCLSQDIIVHETCHALLDGLHPNFVEPSNPDMLALHEAFSDIVAIFQHFSHAAVLRSQIRKTRGDLEKQNMLGALAQEFGRALGRGGALRDFLGKVNDMDEWEPIEPDPAKLGKTTAVHDRGAILVAATFRAFLTIYKARIADLLRIASNGTGVLPNGDIDPDLVNRLADEAAKSARHILRLCIRALDYMPPVDVTFGDYLRAIITADHDLFPDDEHGYRTAIIEAFSAWGIVPKGMPIVTEIKLLWPSLGDVVADDPKQHRPSGTDELIPRRPLNTDVISSRIKQLLLDPMSVMKEMHDGRKNEKALPLDYKSFSNAINEDIAAILKLLGRPDSDRNAKEIFSWNLLDLGLSADRELEYHVRQFYQRLFWGLILFSGYVDQSPKSNHLLDHLGIVFNEPHRAPLVGLKSIYFRSSKSIMFAWPNGRAAAENSNRSTSLSWFRPASDFWTRTNRVARMRVSGSNETAASLFIAAAVPC